MTQQINKIAISDIHTKKSCNRGAAFEHRNKEEEQAGNQTARLVEKKIFGSGDFNQFFFSIKTSPLILEQLKVKNMCSIRVGSSTSSVKYYRDQTWFFMY